MLTPLDNFRAVNGVYAASDALRHAGWYTIVAIFEVQKVDPG